MSYVFIKSEPSLWTVGFYKPDGTWEPESDHDSSDEAARRAARLNGGPAAADIAEAKLAAIADYCRTRWVEHDGFSYVRAYEVLAIINREEPAP